MIMLRGLLVFGLLMVLTACAPFLPVFEEPGVSLTGVRVLPGNGIVPNFEFDLHITNPNGIALKLKGLSYKVELEGEPILTGVSRALPQIEAYGEGGITLSASPDLISTLNLFSKLFRQSRQQVEFRLEAVLDVGGIMPKIRVEKVGKIDLRSESSNLQ